MRQIVCSLSACILFCGIPSLTEASDLSLTKLVLQLEPKNYTRTCSSLSDFVCDDNHLTPSHLNVNGSAQTGYYLYFVAIDINTKIGISSVSFGFEHPSNLYISDWQSACVGSETVLGSWPASGSGIRLNFESCVGTQPAPIDPEGDGSIVLGSMYVYAYSNSTAEIMHAGQIPPVVVSCQGDSISLQSTGPDQLVALGKVGFGGEWVVPACEFNGVVDDPCVAGWSQWMSACCMPDSTCGESQSHVSQRACEFAGGVWTQVRCSVACSDNFCGKVSINPLTWGRLKTRY